MPEIMFLYKASQSFGTKDPGKEPLRRRHLVRSQKELTPKVLKKGVDVVLIDLSSGEAERKHVDLMSEIVIENVGDPLSDREAGRIIMEATQKFMARLQMEVYG